MKRTIGGVTYVELALGVLITGLVIVPIFSLILSSGAGTILTRDEVLAYQVASDILTYAQGLDFDDPFLNEGSPDSTKLPFGASSVGADSGFQRTVTVENHKIPGITHRYKLVSVKSVVDFRWPSAGSGTSRPSF